MKKVLGLLVVLAVVGIAPIFAQMTCAYTDFPPFTYQDETGKITGFFHESVQQVLKEAGFDVVKDFKFVVLPNTRLYKDILSGAVTVNLGIPSVPALKDNVYIGDYPFFNIISKAYYIGEKAPITSKDQFAGKSIIVIRGYTYAGLIAILSNPENKCILSEANTHESALKMLQSGRADYLLDYSAPVEAELNKRNVDGLKSTSLAVLPVYFIIGKAVPGGEALMKKLNSAHQSLIKKGILTPAN